jgi:hypothetical protein
MNAEEYFCLEPRIPRHLRERVRLLFSIHLMSLTSFIYPSSRANYIIAVRTIHLSVCPRMTDFDSTIHVGGRPIWARIRHVGVGACSRLHAYHDQRCTARAWQEAHRVHQPHRAFSPPANDRVF